MNDACVLASLQVIVIYWTGLAVVTLLSLALVATLAFWALVHTLRVAKVYLRFCQFCWLRNTR